MMEEANKDSSNSGTGVSLLARSQLSATTTTTTKTVSTASVAANATEEDKGGSNCYVGHACLQLVPLKTIELHRIKQCLQK